MSDIEKLNALRTMIGENVPDSTLTIYLDFARQVILNKMYPFGIPKDIYDIPERYNYTCLQVATYLYLKRGAEGEIAHNENGVSRTYASADVPNDMISNVVSYVGVF